MLSKFRNYLVFMSSAWSYRNVKDSGFEYLNVLPAASADDWMCKLNWIFSMCWTTRSKYHLIYLTLSLFLCHKQNHHRVFRWTFSFWHKSMSVRVQTWYYKVRVKINDSTLKRFLYYLYVADRNNKKFVHFNWILSAANNKWKYSSIENVQIPNIELLMSV